MGVGTGAPVTRGGQRVKRTRRLDTLPKAIRRQLMPDEHHLEDADDNVITPLAAEEKRGTVLSDPASFRADSPTEYAETGPAEQVPGAVAFPGDGEERGARACPEMSQPDAEGTEASFQPPFSANASEAAVNDSTDCAHIGASGSL